MKKETELEIEKFFDIHKNTEASFFVTWGACKAFFKKKKQQKHL